MFVLRCEDRYALEKRPDEGLLAGLYQFPNILGHYPLSEALENLRPMGLTPKDVYKVLKRQHISPISAGIWRGFIWRSRSLPVTCCG